MAIFSATKPAEMNPFYIGADTDDILPVPSSNCRCVITIDFSSNHKPKAPLWS